MPLPERQGLYDPAFEHDACGLGFVATLRQEATHEVITRALEVLCNLTHRGAAGCDPCTGDGAGILLQIPHAVYRASLGSGARPFDLPEPGDYGVAMCFLATSPARRREQEAVLEAAVVHHDQKVLGWRDVPVELDAVGDVAKQSAPAIRQLFIGRTCAPDLFERRLFMIRKRAGRTINAADFYVASCSSRTVVYKGLMLAEQVAAFYPDLSDVRAVSRLALVHSRFSTNTFPTWDRAHPFRLLAHNGEINTLRGNTTWMRTRESLLKSDLWGNYIEDFTPIIRPGGSDSAALDNMVDFLVASGRSLPHVMMMLVPEAWAGNPEMSEEKKAFYEYHGCLVEPWDGPAALCFTDGRQIGATLDRNGLRPAKYVVTSEGLVVLASEFGVLPLDPATVIQKGRLQPGKMFLVDVEEGRIVSDEEIKHEVASRKPYRRWLDENKLDIAKQPPADHVPAVLSGTELDRLQLAFGYTQEDIKVLLAPMASSGEEPVGSMGIDIPLAVLSRKPQSLYRYFKQHFAQVTNPPIDPLREEIVMSLMSYVGGEGNLLDETPAQCRMLELPHPILTADELAKIRDITAPMFRAATVSCLFPTGGDPEISLRQALRKLCDDARKLVESGAGTLILSDRGVDALHAPIPSLLAVGAVHHSLLRAGIRGRTGLIVESGEPREVAHMALLIGFGAGAINPYVALDTLGALAKSGVLPAGATPESAIKNYIKALKKGLLKTISKMGISTLSSYKGAQIFEAVGIDQVVVDEFFTGTSSRLRGIGVQQIAEESLAHHNRAFSVSQQRLEVGGHYHYRTGGETHLWNPDSVAALQKAVRLNAEQSYDEYARLINDQGECPSTLRGMWELVPAGPPVSLEFVEGASSIVKRFATGAMSFGSISKEAHENLAIAMNRIGGRSNSGEGGEDAARFVPDANGDLRRSSIKQVASARFGVTTQFLVNADDLQIKMAQGAKPGEGGQLPGHKVDAAIARVRHSTPGVTLISPPPHHDIYSIEDLAQLIFDLKNVNPRARISVKLVAEAGVGTIAAGVAKAFADVILISGHDGGTGASPVSSIHHAGLPWELGLAEAQQVLVLNGLRDRVRLQVDGQLKTGRDVVFGALLGAEEFGFSTAPLVASGCVMMRKCHLNTCPVGVATQDPELRKKFAGQPEHVINYFFFVAEEVRRLMAELGFRTIDEMIGRTDCIRPRALPNHPKADRLDFSEVLFRPAATASTGVRCTQAQPLDLSTVIDRELIAEAVPKLERGVAVRLKKRIRNKDRAFGAMLSGEIVRALGDRVLPEDSLIVEAIGSAGQSFGAFLLSGVTLSLEGDANDYVGKGLSGGIVALRPPQRAPFHPEDEFIAGNTVLYGATAGRAFFNGRAGERFAVRNSGAHAVVEGVGDHGCEYMTGGIIIVLGTTGRNFGAGMSGGMAFVLDEDGAFRRRCNPDVANDVAPLQPADHVTVITLLEEHLRRTGSEKARRILESWPTYAASFVSIVPAEFRKAIAASGPVVVAAPRAPGGKDVAHG